MKFNFCMIYSLLFFLGTTLFSCEIETAKPVKQKQLTIASDYLKKSDESVFRNFTKRSGIKVNIIHLSPSKITGKFRQDKFNSGIDIVMLKSMTDVLSFHKKELLHPLKQGIHFPEGEVNSSSEKFDYIGFGYDPYIVALPKSHSIGIRMYSDLTRHKFSTNLTNNELVPMFAPILSKKNRVEANTWVKKFFENSKRDTTYSDSVVQQIPILTSYSSFHCVENRTQFKDKVSVFPNTKSTGTFYNLRTMAIAYQAANFEEAIAFIHYYFNTKNNRVLNKKLNTIGIHSNKDGFRKYYMNSEKMASYYLTIERLIRKIEKN